jgi:hypothetical protein
MKRFLVLLLLAIVVNAGAQSKDSVKVEKPSKKWFESITLRGYTQVRFNRLLETNPDLVCEQCDKSWGEDGGFFIRRMRLIFYGQISDHVYFYIQPDLASSVSSTSLHWAQLRDAYFDIGIDKKSEFRFRIGQSKVPYGFENLQSSQNRLPLDRNDAMNSAVSNERDLGVYFYWAPEKIRKRFSQLAKDGLKTSGDYGVFGLGIYNGQTANKPELNDNKHIVARLSYPIEIGSQTIEPGVQGYSGDFTIPSSQISSGAKVNEDATYLDQRFAGTLVLYPKPFGILAEYNVGKGPEFNTATDSIETRDLSGGFVTISYMLKLKNHIVFPFARIQHYEGGKKHEQDARSYTVDEMEFGIEWQPFKEFELVAMYTISERRFEDFGHQDNTQKGQLLRLQAQLNF